MWRGPVAGGASYPVYGSVSGAGSRSSVTCWERGYRGVRHPDGFLTASWVADVSVVRFAGRRRGSGGSRGSTPLGSRRSMLWKWTDGLGYGPGVSGLVCPTSVVPHAA